MEARVPTAEDEGGKGSVAGSMYAMKVGPTSLAYKYINI